MLPFVENKYDNCFGNYIWRGPLIIKWKCIKIGIPNSISKRWKRDRAQFMEGISGSPNHAAHRRTHGFLPGKKAPVGNHRNKSDSNVMDYTMKLKCHFRHTVHCKKIIDFPVQARTWLTKLSMARNNQYYSRPGRVWSVASRLGTGKLIIVF